MSEINLLPCPFCGGEAKLTANDVGYIIICDNHDCIATTDLFFSSEQAISAWNRRSPPAAVPSAWQAFVDGKWHAVEDPIWHTQKGYKVRPVYASPPAAVPDGWRPFPTCPEDGTAFQAWVIGSNGHGSWEPRCRINPETGAFEIWGRVDYDQDDWATYSHVAPTHWMPLPAAPTEASDE